MGGGKDGSISQIAQGCQPGTRQILKVGTLGYHNQLKKKLYMKKKGSAQNSAFCAGLTYLKEIQATQTDEKKVIMGDFNINILKKAHQTIKNLCNDLKTKQLINTATTKHNNNW